MSLRLKKRGEKALEQALVVSNPGDDPTHVKWKGSPDEETIHEDEEPPITWSTGAQLGTQFRRKGSADARRVDARRVDDL